MSTRIVRGRASTHLAALAGSLACAIVVTYPLAARLSSHVPIPRYLMSQPWRHVYWFEVWSLWLVRHIPLWRLQFSTDLIFYPTGIYIPWLSQSLSTAAVAFPLQAFLPPVPVGNVLTIAALAIAGYTAFLLARDVTGDPAAAFVSGVIYMSAPIVTANAQGHLYVITMLFEVPLYLWLLLKLLANPRPAYGVGAGLVFAVSIFSYWYCPVFLAIYTGVFVIVDLLQNRRTRSHVRRLVRAGAALAIVVGPVVLFVLLPFLLPAARVSPSGALQSPMAEIESWSVDLLAFLVPAYDHWLLGKTVASIRATFTANPTLQTDYVGYVALVCVALAALQERRFVAVRWFWSAAAFFLLALGPVLHVAGGEHLAAFGTTFTVRLPHGIVYSLPPFSGVRDLSMYVVPLMLSVAILAGIGVRNILVRLQAVPRKVAFIVLLGLVLADFAILPFPVVPVRVPAAYNLIAGDPTPGSVLELPWSTTIPVYEYYQTVHGRPLLTGYLGRLDPWYARFAQDSPVVKLFAGQVGPGAVSRASADEFLRFFDVRYVIVHESIAGEEEFRRLSDTIQTLFAAHRVDSGEHLAVYRVDAPAGGAPLPLTFEFSPDGADPGLKFGWSNPEQRDGVTTAWVDGTRSTLWVDLPRPEPLVLTMRVEPVAPPGVGAETMKVSANGHAIGTIRLPPGWGTYSLHLPVALITKGTNRFDFAYGFCAVPAKVDSQSTDTRCLSVAFDFVRIDADAGR